MSSGSAGAYESFGNLGFDEATSLRNHRPPSSTLEALGRYALPDVGIQRASNRAPTQIAEDILVADTPVVEILKMSA